MNLSQAAHGDCEFGYILTRLGIARTTVVGPVSSPSVLAHRHLGPGGGRLARRDPPAIVRFGDNMPYVEKTRAGLPTVRHVTGDGATVRRRLTRGDTVRLQLPVTPRFTAPDRRIDAVQGCVAVESVDLPEGVDLERVEVDPSQPPSVTEAGVRVAARVVHPPTRSFSVPGHEPVDSPAASDDRLSLPLVP